MNRRIKKKKKMKLNIKRIALFISICVCLYFLVKYRFPIATNNGNIINNIFSSNSSYDVIKQDENSNYSGVGQEKVKNKDGYFTTFTTDNNKIYKEYKQNGTSSWKDKPYWDNTMESDGCGITAISIILSGYGKDYTPENLRRKYYPVLNGDRISSELQYTFGIANSDFLYDSSSLSNTEIKNHLEKNKPILICVWNRPYANRWTTASHYMVLLASDGNDMVYVSNPNGLENDSKSSGWYNMNEVTPYIAKVLYIEE